MDEDKRVITLESLKRNSRRMGLDGLEEEEMRGMIREGDLDGDGVLSEMEFCVLMVRLSPGLMENCWGLVEEGLGLGF
ncbi:Calcium-binding protein KIC-like protein [Drosera capensis]